jgi:hypothetical protein
MNHTPGPWHVSKRSHGGAICGVDGPNGECVAVIWADAGDGMKAHLPEWETNAHVLAAAPEMLEALRDILEKIERNEGPLTGLEIYIRDRAQAASTSSARRKVP